MSNNVEKKRKKIYNKKIEREKRMKKRILVLFVSLIITFVFVYFSIPKFFSKEKVTDLLNRVNEYIDYENE